MSKFLALADRVFFNITSSIVVADWLSLHYDVTDHLATVQQTSGFDSGDVREEIDIRVTTACLWNCCWGAVVHDPFLAHVLMLPCYPSLLLLRL